MFARKVFAASALALALSVSAQAETKRYLVQFNNSATFHSVAQSVMAHDAVAPGVMAPMRLFNSDATVATALNHVEMLVVESSNAAAVQSLKKHPAVALVEEEIFHPAPKPMATFGLELMASKKAPKFRMDQPWGIDAVKAPGAWTQTKGDTATVMVLDTGLDKEHAALMSRFVKGQNFTGGSADDFSDTIGHGTHVAGTILADGLNGGLVGVAPEAKLMMGKVCAARGCSSIAITQGLDWAVAEKADVVNMSLGGFFISDGEAKALQRAEAAGVMVVAASGNGGIGSVSYPAAVPTVMAVGAVDINLVKADFSQWGPELDVVAPGVDVVSAVPRGTGRGSEVMTDLDGKSVEVKSLPFQGSPVIDLNAELAFAGLGKPEDFTNVAMTGKIALISRGEIPFKEKLANALNAGAIGMIVFNNADGIIQGSLTEDGSEASAPAAMIEKAVGESLRDALAANSVVKASLKIQRTDYASLQGTSMATPHVAGVAALVRAANKNLTPAQVRDVLMETATELGPNDQNWYGKGIVNAEAAVAKAMGM